MSEFPDIIYLTNSEFEGVQSDLVWCEDSNPGNIPEDELEYQEYVSVDYVYNLLNAIEQKQGVNRALKDLKDVLGEVDIGD